MHLMLYMHGHNYYVCVVWCVCEFEFGPVPWPPTELSCCETLLNIYK